MRRRAIILAAFLAALLVAPIADAAFTALMGNTGNGAVAASLSLSDDDGGSAVLQMANATPPASDSGCTRVSYTGSVPSDLRHFITRSGDLVDRGGLRLRVTRGTNSTPSFRSCSGFAADATDYHGLGAGVVYDGPLAAWGTSYDTASLDPSGVAGGRYASAVAGTSGLTDHYRLGESAGPTAVDAAGGTGGVYAGVPVYGATPPPAGVGNGAVTFNSADDRVDIPRSVSDDFTVELWFKTTAASGPGGAGYQGLVDGGIAVGAGTGAFGIVMEVDGRIGAGRDWSPAAMAYTRKGYADGKWHHVAVTRERSSGSIRVYVDGYPGGSVAGDTTALNAAQFTLGRTSSGALFAGTLDEVAVYDRVLTEAEIRSHHRVALDPETWTGGEHHDYKHELFLAQDFEAIDARSATATLRWEARAR